MNTPQEEEEDDDVCFLRKLHARNPRVDIRIETALAKTVYL